MKTHTSHIQKTSVFGITGSIIVVTGLLLLLPFLAGAQPTTEPPGGVVNAQFNALTVINGINISGLSGVTAITASSPTTALQVTGGSLGILATTSSGTAGRFQRGGTIVNLATPTRAVEAVGSISSTESVTAPQICIGSACRSAWPSGTCPSGQVMNGFLANGSISCIDMDGGSPPPSGDTTPPTANITAPFNGQQFSAGTTQATLSVTTNEAATCRWHTSNVAYASMSNSMTGSGGTTHSATMTGLSNGGSYTRYVRCTDSAGNAMTTSSSVSFSVAAPAGDTTPPTANITAPWNGQQFAAGTTQATLSVTTNEAATCRWHTSNTQYVSMPNFMSGSGGFSHSSTMTGLTNGGSYTRYVRCTDSAGNAMTTSSSVSFSVAASAPLSAPTGLTATTISSSQIRLSWNPVAGATHYAFYRCTGTSCNPTGIGMSWGATSTPFTNNGLSANTQYNYQVLACTSTAWSDCSGPSNVAGSTTTP